MKSVPKIDNEDGHPLAGGPVNAAVGLRWGAGTAMILETGLGRAIVLEPECAQR